MDNRKSSHQGDHSHPSEWSRGIPNAPDGKNTYDGDAREDRRSQDRSWSPRESGRDYGTRSRRDGSERDERFGRPQASDRDAGQRELRSHDQPVNYGEHYGQSAYGKVQYSREALGDWQDPRDQFDETFSNREQDYRAGTWNRQTHDYRPTSRVDWQSGEHAGKGPKNYKRADERIHEDVCDQLARHGAVDASDIEVRVEDGEVTLSGQVRDKRMKRLAEDISDSVPGVQEVLNQIRLTRPDDSSQSSMKDKPGRNGAAKNGR